MGLNISKATERNWARLKSDPTHRLSSRANKTRSVVRFIPKERCSQPATLPFIEKILSFESKVSLENILYSLCLALLRQRKADSKRIAEFASEYSHCVLIEEIAGLDLPEEFDLLGTVYQSFLTEGDKNKVGSYYTVQRTADELLRVMKLGPGTSFLDPCCGSGTFLILAQRLGCSVRGFDNDALAVMIAKANLISEGSARYPDIQCLDFRSYEAAGSDLFDASASNPPWGKGASKGYSDIACEFFLKTFSLLKKGGKIHFLLPNSLLNVASHKSFREHLLADGKLSEIHLFGSDFSGVQTAFFSALSEKTNPAKTIRFIDRYGTQYSVPAKVYELTPQKNIFWASPEELSALKKILSKGTVSLEKSLWGLGIVTGNNKAFLKDAPAAGLKPIYTGKEIRPFFPEKPKKYIYFDRTKFQQTAKEEIYRTRPKLIYKFISSRPVFALDDQGTLLLNSANVLIPKETPFSIEALLALLNSEAFAFAHRVLFGEVKFLQGNLVPIKLPEISDFEDRILKERVLEVRGNPNKILDINERIFALYGLEPAEIDAVKKRLGFKKA